jgi:hypothetical protein
MMNAGLLKCDSFPAQQSAEVASCLQTGLPKALPAGILPESPALLFASDACGEAPEEFHRLLLPC